VCSPPVTQRQKKNAPPSPTRKERFISDNVHLIDDLFTASSLWRRPSLLTPLEGVNSIVNISAQKTYFWAILPSIDYLTPSSSVRLSLFNHGFVCFVVVFFQAHTHTFSMILTCVLPPKTNKVKLPFSQKEANQKKQRIFPFVTLLLFLLSNEPILGFSFVNTTTALFFGLASTFLSPVFFSSFSPQPPPLQLLILDMPCFCDFDHLSGHKDKFFFCVVTCCCVSSLTE